jgi:phage major head subunit gpT-like protein
LFGYSILNRTFESTITVKRADIEDDTVGVLGPLFKELGLSAKQHPDELIFGLLKQGFTSPCYDGQNFFDSEHPTSDENGQETTVSNMGAGAAPAWFLMDTTRAIKPLVYQERVPFKLQACDQDGDAHVFLRDEFLYGIRGRANAGFGLWQLAFGSKATLDADAYRDARAQMAELRGDEGRILGIAPNVLLVPPSLEEAGLQILNADRDAAGASNVWKGTARLIVTPWLS